MLVLLFLLPREMLRLVLHAAVPFGVTAPMDDDPGYQGEEEYLRAARDEAWERRHTGKATITCLAPLLPRYLLLSLPLSLSFFAGVLTCEVVLVGGATRPRP